MAGQDMSDVDAGDKPPTGAPDELMSKPRWQRALISFAGPAVNLILPIFLLTGLFAVAGVPYPAYLDEPVRVTASPANSDAGLSPLKPGDTVLSINGTATPNWEQAFQALKQVVPGTTVKMEVEDFGTRQTIE